MIVRLVFVAFIACAFTLIASGQAIPLKKMVDAVKANDGKEFLSYTARIWPGNDLGKPDTTWKWPRINPLDREVIPVLHYHAQAPDSQITGHRVRVSAETKGSIEISYRFCNQAKEKLRIERWLSHNGYAKGRIDYCHVTKFETWTNGKIDVFITTDPIVIVSPGYFAECCYVSVGPHKEE